MDTTLLVSYRYTGYGDYYITGHNGGYNTPAYDNPFLFRGYYYDHDLYLYVLGTRLYDPNNFRFISPDRADVIFATPNGLTDKNLYAYCDNNPVMRVDQDGEFWLVGMLIGAAIGAVVNGAVSAISQKITEGSVNWGEVAVSAAAGAITGAVATTGIGAFGNGVINALVSGMEMGITDAINGEETNDAELLLTMVVSGATAGEGINTSKMRGIYKRSKEVLNTTHSATKRGIYDMKIKTIRKKAIKETIFFIGAAGASVGIEFGKDRLLKFYYR